MVAAGLEFVTRLTAGPGTFLRHGNTASAGAGPRFSRRALLGGADWPDGEVVKFDPRYALESHDGALPANRPEKRRKNFRAASWFETGALDG